MFDSTALLGLFRPFCLLSQDHTARPFWACRAAELIADWIFIVALFIILYAITAEIALVALFMLLRILPRGRHRQLPSTGHPDRYPRPIPAEPAARTTDRQPRVGK